VHSLEAAAPPGGCKAQGCQPCRCRRPPGGPPGPAATFPAGASHSCWRQPAPLLTIRSTARASSTSWARPRPGSRPAPRQLLGRLCSSAPAQRQSSSRCRWRAAMPADWAFHQAPARCSRSNGPNRPTAQRPAARPVRPSPGRSRFRRDGGAADLLRRRVSCVGGSSASSLSHWQPGREQAGQSQPQRRGRGEIRHWRPMRSGGQLRRHRDSGSLQRPVHVSGRKGTLSACRFEAACCSQGRNGHGRRPAGKEKKRH